MKLPALTRVTLPVGLLAFVFLVVPFASLLLMVVIAAIAIRIPPTTD